ncbi:MAG TPA: hypothetical protein VNO31_16635 [Umezawaea sp.]|nr:hypothetical protein [Umezawaea sp.]
MANPSWDDVKKVVDNPAVSYEDKKALLQAYYANDVKDDITGTHNDELEEYLDDYDISWGDGQWQATKDAMPWADSSEDRLKDAYDKGKKAADEGDARNAQHEKDKKAGQDALDASAKRASDGGAGVGNSNDLLDAGAPGLKYFENFLPVYEYAKKIIDGGSVDTNVDGMRKRYDEQRDINFNKIDIDIVELRQVAQDSRDRQGDAEKSMSKLWSGWDGKAADTSRKFVTDMSQRAATHADAIDHIAEVTRAACHTVSGLVNTKARTVLEGVRNVNDIAGLSPDQIKEVVDGCTAEDEAKLRRVAGFVHYTIDDSCGDGDEWKRLVREEANKWIRGTFKADVDGKWKVFDTICTTTKDSVDKAWEELGKQIDAFNTKPFDPPKETPAEKPADNTGNGNGNGNSGNTGSTGTGSTGTGSTGTGSTGTGSSGTGGTGTGSAPATPSIPEMPKPENPLDKDGDGKPDDANGDGKPDDLDGDGKPDTPGGEGGKPGEEKNPESVTITSGANEIKITEPDARGHVKVTVDTPNAPPKTYDLDFSKNPDAAKALMAQNGAAGLAQALTGQGGGGQAAGGTTPGAAPTPGSAPAGGGAIPIEAGADGKAVIEMDGLSITAEVDPLTGEISLTVDDGEGEPQQYGVEFGEDEPEGGGTSGRPDVTTMPAFAEAQQGVGTMPAFAEGFTEPGQGGATDQAFARDLGGQGFAEPAFAEAQGSGGQGFSGQGFTEPVAAQGFGDQGFGPQGFSGQGFTEPSFSAPSFGDQGFTQPGFTQPGFTEPASAQPAGFTAPGFTQPGVDPVFREPSQEGTTSVSGASAVGGGFDRADSILGPQVPSGAAESAVGPQIPGSAADPMWGPPASTGEAGLADTNASQAGEPGSASLPSMQDGAQSGQPAGGMMGGGMMGGPPPGGGGQQGSGDTERGASQWRTTGSLFDDDAGLGRVQGALGEETAR